MSKYKYTAEYEIKASPQLLYEYLATAYGLSEWFAERVEVKQAKLYDIYWDNESHLAKIAVKRTNKMIRYVFVNGEDEKHTPKDASYLEFKLSYNDFTESTFLSVTDYSDMEDDKALEDLWNGLVNNLKNKVGG
ncbi:MAG: ATPase [Bernardetiaceae bacterium]|nr:ATPase [Bernardetiaceae bacterium]